MVGGVVKRNSGARFGSAPLMATWGTSRHVRLCATSNTPKNMYLQYAIATPMQSGLTKVSLQSEELRVENRNGELKPIYHKRTPALPPV